MKRHGGQISKKSVIARSSNEGAFYFPGYQSASLNHFRNFCSLFKSRTYQILHFIVQDAIFILRLFHHLVKAVAGFIFPQNSDKLYRSQRDRDRSTRQKSTPFFNFFFKHSYPIPIRVVFFNLKRA